MRVSAVIIACALLATRCASLNVVSYDNWDQNRDKALDRYEFISGYMKSNFFFNWSNGKKSINYQTFHTALFNSLDTDSNEKLSSQEFSLKIPFYLQGVAIDPFGEWDGNLDSSIDKNEFLAKITSYAIAAAWDPSGDGNITEREFAGQMFNLADPDANGLVTVLEFNVWYVNR